MTRTIYLISMVTRNHISQYSSNHFDKALNDINSNGYTAIDIKFDMDGDIVIFCIPMIWWRYKMLKANIEAAIDEKEKELNKNRDEILKLDNVLEFIKLQQKKLLEKDTDLCYELEELKEQLNG